jgi:hypothetical protein
MCGKSLYGSFSTGYFQCLACPSNCSSCAFIIDKPICTQCLDGFILDQNNSCVNSSTKAISLSQDSEEKLTVFKTSEKIENFTLIFWIKLYDYNNFISKISPDSNNYIFSVDVFTLLLNYKIILELNCPSKIFAYNYNNSFDIWTMIGLTWNSKDKKGFYYFSNSAGIFTEVIYDAISLQQITIGSTSFGLFRSLQIYKDSVYVDPNVVQ